MSGPVTWLRFKSHYGSIADKANQNYTSTFNPTPPKDPHTAHTQVFRDVRRGYLPPHTKISNLLILLSGTAPQNIRGLPH
jgi:hypothetical protein